MKERATALHVAAVACGWLLVSCGAPPDPPPSPEPPDSPAAAAVEPEDDRVLVVFLGDSLTAGLGLEEEQAYPAVTASLLAAEGFDLRVVNAGVSGDTTAGGVARLDWLLRQEPDVLVVSLGANDGLRGLAVEHSEENLCRIVERARRAGARVLLCGMLMPPNYGPYAEEFNAVFPRLAAELEVPLVPFLLEGVAARPELNLADGMHPNAEGQRRMAETLLPYLRPLVDVATADAAS